MRSILKHIRRWNIWKKRCANGWIHKILVLFSLRESITFKMTLLPEEKSLIYKGFEDGINQVKNAIISHSAMRYPHITGGNMKKLLFFHASWCPPCRFYEKQFITPLEDLAGPEYIERVDAWKFPQKAEKYMIDRLPAVVLLDGETIHMIRTGAIDIDKVAEWLKGE